MKKPEIKTSPPETTAIAGWILAALLALLAVSVVYPSRAWHGVGLLSGCGILLLLTIVFLKFRSAFDGWGGTGWLIFATFSAWTLLRMSGAWWAPYLPDATSPAATAGLMASVLIIAFACARVMQEGALRMTGRFLLLLCLTMSIHAQWQMYGPAGLPGTFATMELRILETVAEGDPMREGLLHAVREGRASSTLGAPNIFGSFCVVGFLIGAGLLVLGGGYTRAIGGVAAGLCAWALILSGSRGGVLAAVAAGGLLVILLSAWRWGHSPRFRPVTLGLIGLFGVLSAGLLVLFSLIGGSSRWTGASGLGQRLHYWRSAIEAFKEAPILGQGTGSYPVVYLLYRQPGANETRFPHSWFFESLGESGIIGTVLLLAFLVVFMGFLVAAVYTTARDRRCEPTDFALLCGLVAAGIAAWVHGLAEYTLSFREAAFIGMLPLGVAAGVLAKACSPANGEKQGGWITVTLFGVLLIAGTALWVRADWRMLEALELRKEAIYLYENPATMNDAMEAINLAIRLAPEDAAGWETRAIFRQAQRDGRALRDLEEAAARNPHSARIKERLSMFHESAGDRDQALLFQRQAVASHPLDVSHRLRLAEMLYRRGEFEEARDQWRRTIGLHVPTIAIGQNRERIGEILRDSEELQEQ